MNPDDGPRQPILSIATLMRRLASGDELAGLVNIAANDPDGANSLMSLSAIFHFTGNPEMGLELQAKALNLRQHFHLSRQNNQTEICLLAIMRPGGMMDNTPLDFLLDHPCVAVDLLFVSTDLPVPTALPDHDLIFIGISQSEHNQPLLKLVENLIKLSSRPILNTPERITRLSRDSVSAMLQHTPDIEIPVTKRISRSDLQQIASGEKSITLTLEDGDFPIIARPTDSHAGKALNRIDNQSGITTYLKTQTASEFHIARFVDYHSLDGLYRKCRLVLIDCRPYAVHLAISDHWMVHYTNAGMSENAARRQEEEQFMANFDQNFAQRHHQALHAIAKRLELDYVVIDCGETTDGRLLVFEADNIGFVHAMDPVDLFPYKQPQMQKVFEAFYQMLKHAVRQHERA